MNTINTQKLSSGDPPNQEALKLAAGKNNGVESKKVKFTPTQIAQIIRDARISCCVVYAFPPPGSLMG